MASPANELCDLLEEVDTAPEGAPLDDALDALLDFVQTHRGAILTALEAAATAGQTAPDQALLRSYMRVVEQADGVTYVPAAVDRRGLSYIPLAVPDHMTETAFQMLLEEEAKMMEETRRAEMGGTLRTDLKRRQLALDAQNRRDRQIAALGPPLAGRRPHGTA